MEYVSEPPLNEDQPHREQRRILALLSVASLLLIFAAAALLVWKIPPTSDTVFLHYNIYFGIDKTGPWWELLLIPGSGLIFFLLNTAAIFFVKNIDPLFKMVLAVTTLVLQLMSVVAVVLVILLNR